MDVLTREELKKLISESGGVCISIYMPTYRVGREIEQGPIRLKNLLKEAEKHLLTDNLRTPQIRTLLGPAEPLLVDGLFWQYQSDGLALFLSSEGLRYYRLPLRFDALVTVSERFHIKPLFPLFIADGRLFVLAISQNEVRLLQCTPYTVDEVDLGEVPTSLGQALRFDDPESRLQFHTGTSTPGGGVERSALFHGHGVGVDDDKSNILRYFQKIDKRLKELLRDEQAPLVFAGVKNLLPIYREANSYPHLVEECIEGNPEELSAEVLHQRAWEIVHSRFVKAQKEAAMQYQRLSNLNSEQASDDIRKIVPAAYGGRVDTLFVAIGIQRWGMFDPNLCMARLHEEAKPGGEDLLDFAAVHTFLNGGTVYALEPKNMLGDSPIAAIFRY
jgi:hypothetical protein